MADIIDIIKFEGKAFSELTDNSQKNLVIQAANKLKFLENEIMKYPEGGITIKQSRDVLVTMFPYEIQKQIQDRLEDL
jgi:hypothetical protein